MPSSNLVAVVVAAGSSQRMGFDKLTAPLLGKPLIAHSLSAFQCCPEVDAIVLVCSAARVEEFTQLAAEFPKVARIVPGGRERIDSVLRGLEAFEAPEPAFVAVHDGARPLITPEAISACFREAVEFGAAVCAEPETDTIHRVDGDLCTVENVPRKNLWRMQTPQVTEYGLLLSLIREMEETGAKATDEISVLIRSGGKARVVETPDWNFKVTFPRDLQLAETVLKGRLP